MRSLRLVTATTVLGLAVAASSGAEPTPPMASDVPAKFVPPNQAADFERRDVMIAMRDGVKLHTVIVVPKGAKRAPIVLSRTPYNAGKRAQRMTSNLLAATLPI